MPSQIDEFYEFYQDLHNTNENEFHEEQVKRWHKLKHAALVILIVIITLAFIKCLQCCIRRKNKKSKFEFLFSSSLCGGWNYFIVVFAATQQHHSRESIQTVESNDTQFIPTPSAPSERESLPPSYFDAINFEKENKLKMIQ